MKAKIKFSVYLAMLFLISGCLVYDPPSGVLEIKNNYHSPVYVWMICDSTLGEMSPISYDEQLGIREYYRTGKVTYFPRNRIDSDSTKQFSVGGSISKPVISCIESNLVYFYIFDEDVILNTEWDKIVDSALYRDRFTLTQQFLDSNKWSITVPLF